MSGAFADGFKVREEKQKAKWERVRLHALAQGLVLVQMSPRRFVVFKLDTRSGGYFLAGGGSLSYHTNLQGEVVFKGSWATARDYIVANSTPIPPEALKD
jgi:hypothetical protein